MENPGTSLISDVIKTFRKPALWVLILLFIILILFHYADSFPFTSGLQNLISNDGITRHTIERILFLIPVVWSGFLFGMRGAIVASLVALVCMLPRVFILSEASTDALIESIGVTLVGFFIGGISAFSQKLFKRERTYIQELEKAHHDLVISEERYRKLFENAHDGIWLQDMDGNIVTANEASSRMTGYDTDEYIGMNVRTFLPPSSLELARKIRQRLLNGETMDGSYDQMFLRKDGREVYLRLSTSLLVQDGNPVAFQHIARDVTNEKRMEENLQFYLQEATEAQEEERKRISRELHDDTIQALVVLSQQLDILASKSTDLSDNDRQQIEKLQHDTVDIMRGVRRLSQDLRPAALDRLGLLPALEWLVADTQEYSGIDINIITTGEKRRLEEYEELIMFRITQEALRNAWKHSDASRINVHVEFTTVSVRIVVSDNGLGFTPPESIGDLAKQGKLGLAGMHERARLIGAKLEVKSKPDKGTDITVELVTDIRLRLLKQTDEEASF